MTRPPETPISDSPPSDDCVTVYDRDHLKLYMRLLDAQSSGATLSEVCLILFGIDAEAEPERARTVHDNHLGRAHWMTEQGYRDLLKHGLPGDSTAR